jgi:membrane protein YdbS with pleckstrin-like domain
MRRVIIKEGPLVFLRNVLYMEIIAFIFFFVISFLTDYSAVYNNLGLARFIRFDVFEILLFSIFQLFYISSLFLNWYFSHYEIYEKEIIKKTGLLFRRRKSVSLFDVASVEVYQSPLGRMMNHATIVLDHNNGRTTKIKNVSNFDEYIHIIKQLVRSTSGRVPTRDPKILIKEGEGLFTEFKETLRYDARRGEISKELEKVIVKTVVGFLNANGGTLIIGVDDQGKIVGLENDYKTLPKKDRDGFENHISMLVKTMIGLAFAKYVTVNFEEIENKEICLVTVNEGHKPAYLKNGDNKEDFYVRVGNSTQPYSMSEASEYIKSKWG